MQPSYGRPQYAPEPPAVSLTRARPWLVGLAASATMLLLILAIGNPPVTRAIYRHAVSDGFGSRTLQSLGYFAWDFGRLDDGMHLGWANLVFDLVVLVLVLLLVAALASRRGSFWRTLLAVWVSVIVAVLLSGYVRAAILDPMGTAPVGGKADVDLLLPVQPGSAAALRGDALRPARGAGGGTRRRPHPPARGRDGRAALAELRAGAVHDDDAAATPWSAPPAAVPGPVAEPSPWSTTDAEGEDDRTTQLPAVGSTGAGQQVDDGTEHTRALPRIEDDRPHG